MKFVITRDIAVKVNWMLDNLVPPILRDSKCFMHIIESIIYGKKGSVFLNFKENSSYLNLSTKELRETYIQVSDASSAMTRPTDLNSVMEKRLLAHLEKKRAKGLKILDIACGRGYLSKKVASLSTEFQVYGVDIYIPPILKSNKNLHFKEGEIEKIPFSDNYFDIVICTYTLEHVINLENALSELRRVCREELIAVVPCEREYQYTTNLHTYWFPYDHTVKKLFHNPNGEVHKWGGDFIYFESMKS